MVTYFGLNLSNVHVVKMKNLCKFNIQNDSIKIYETEFMQLKQIPMNGTLSALKLQLMLMTFKHLECKFECIIIFKARKMKHSLGQLKGKLLVIEILICGFYGFCAFYQCASTWYFLASIYQTYFRIIIYR